MPSPRAQRGLEAHGVRPARSGPALSPRVDEQPLGIDDLLQQTNPVLLAENEQSLRQRLRACAGGCRDRGQPALRQRFTAARIDDVPMAPTFDLEVLAQAA